MSDIDEQTKEYFKPVVSEEASVEQWVKTITHGANIHHFLMDKSEVENSMTFHCGDVLVIYQRKGKKDHFDLWKEQEARAEKAEVLLGKAKPILIHVARYGSTGFNDQKIAQEILKELEK